MEKKRMGKQAAITALVGLIACAILLGALLLNKGDGPVTGMILSGAPVADAEAYADAAEQRGDDIFLVVSNAFNKYQTDYQSAIPAGSELYASVYFVECPAGSDFTAKILNDGTAVFEQEGTLETGPYGMICYPLDCETLPAGDYVFALYDGEEQIFSQPFTLE